MSNQNKSLFCILLASLLLICKSLSKSKKTGLAPILRIVDITDGKVSFETSTLLFFYT
jgi:hypothetical protein